jgi:prepilin-type processing-associated H-X9-DG protein
LNKYIQAGDTYRCPSDKGDPQYVAQTSPPGESCYESWGNSYLMPWKGLAGGSPPYGWYGINGIGGFEFPGQPSIPSMKMAEMQRHGPTRKIVLMDWAAGPARPRTDESSAWHSERGRGLFNILYGDNHVESYIFKDTERPPHVGYTTPADLSKRNYW